MRRILILMIFIIVIPTQLLPKYKKRIGKEAGRLTFTNLRATDEKTGHYIRNKEEEISEGMASLCHGATGWDKIKNDLLGTIWESFLCHSYSE